ncbi:PREDICTED: uncharacterized protein LOC108374723 [Rhagoletis zephyria]|uniref:uncharacterized protein LOC108374723 n=1 Tax=Rhagoletis zephyria TaxID=28612 RepID=UPI0008112844|nr:PREDICTED: uncharacterized protein LOC108374723 [Rhagoletis zephyria]
MKCSAFAIVILCSLSGLSKAEQPYNVKNEASECLKGLRETLYECDFKLVGRQRLLNGTFSINDDIASDHYTFQVDLFSSPLGDGQYKLLPMGVPRLGVCEGMRDLYTKVVQPSLIEGENTNFPFIPEEGLCPIPKGKYFIKNMKFDTDSWPNQIPRGLLKAVLTIFKDGVDVGRGALYMRVVDRE